MQKWRRKKVGTITIGRSDGELPRDDEVGEEHEEEADDEAGVEMPLRPALEASPPGLRLAAHRRLSSSSSSSSSAAAAALSYQLLTMYLLVLFFLLKTVESFSVLFW
jgi:hypothetical protein